MKAFAWFSTFGAPKRGRLGAALLFLGCAGELDKDPNGFSAAFGDVPTAGTGGTSATGGAGPMGGGMTGTTGGTTGGSGTGGGAATPPDDPCVAPLFASKCNTGCHGGEATGGGGLKLDGSGLGARLSTTLAKYSGVADTSTCVQGALIIDPNEPSNSFLLKKVSAKHEGCGYSMPLGTSLMGDELACIQAWVNKF